MVKPASGSVDLEFSQKYDKKHARHYFEKHQANLSRRLSHRMEEHMARKALQAAGNPATVMDLPCGAGRFWPLLLSQQNRKLIAADNSPNMIETGLQNHQALVKNRIETLTTSVFAIDLPDNAVESVFCMRLLHHIGDAGDRQTMFAELQRVASKNVIISLWVDGNIKSWQRKRLEKKRDRQKKHKIQNRFVLPAKQIEKEFADAGFSINTHFDFFPFLSMWRVYVLECPSA
ncbi:MAG: class I SAM-dependent methyltransferase [Pseudomonadales bacterium]|nr:class I SAM-dependent methyltransferase [Pseudomonadales bacterium]